MKPILIALAMTLVPIGGWAGWDDLPMSRNIIDRRADNPIFVFSYSELRP